MGYQSQRIRDPLHNIIEFEANEFDDMLWQLVQTQPFQRLRRIKQLGFSEFVYPGATHTRFAHSLGVLHNARRLVKIIQKFSSQPKDSRVEIALAAALLHDVGHGPFSHAFEAVGKELNIDNAHHETVSQRLISDPDSEVCKVLNSLHAGMAQDVGDLIAKKKRDIYSAVVDSQFDADRLDYMQRDRLMTGTQTGAIDLEWLLNNLEIGHDVPIYTEDGELSGKQDTFVVGPKAVRAAETYVLGLFQLYPTVYLHKATRGAELLFKKLLVQTLTLIRGGNIKDTGLPRNHPLVKFALKPDVLSYSQDLDDFVIWGSLQFMCEAKDPIVKEMANRLKSRKLYKAIDVRIQVEKDVPSVPVKNRKMYDERLELIDEICGRIHKELKECEKNNLPLMVDNDKRTPYKKLESGSSDVVPIVVNAHGGLKDSSNYRDLSYYSEVVSASTTYKLLRAYYPEEDSKMKQLICDVTSKHVKDVLTAKMVSTPQNVISLTPAAEAVEESSSATPQEPVTAAHQDQATDSATPRVG